MFVCRDIFSSTPGSKERDVGIGEIEAGEVAMAARCGVTHAVCSNQPRGECSKEANHFGTWHACGSCGQAFST